MDVVCGIFIKDEKVLIAKRKYGSSKGKYEFPGGKVEKNETKEEALIREWKEECGITLEKIIPFMTSVDFQDGMHIELTSFLCTSSQIPQCLEHEEFIWTTPEHIYDYNFFEADRQLVECLEANYSKIQKEIG
ncbi:MAG: (deoxy)nucleoside triphosphate pyrophosphohydrolase [Holdemanella sp.]|nr:(deoxy)nucleoside triphosphate pyrophosphohydrolase [Holdemanella sp.]